MVVLTGPCLALQVVDALRCLPSEAALRALNHLGQAVSSIQISTVRSVPAYIMSIIAKHQPGREGRLRDPPGKPALLVHFVSAVNMQTHRLVTWSCTVSLQHVRRECRRLFWFVELTLFLFPVCSSSSPSASHQASGGAGVAPQPHELDRQQLGWRRRARATGENLQLCGSSL